MQKYQFEFDNMEFTKDGSLDELIALDRYAIPAYDGYQVGDTVVAIVDDKGSKRVAEVTSIDNDKITIKDRFGEKHTLDYKLLHKPLETKPSHMWERWAMGASSVEKTKELKEKWNDEFRWLTDGFRYSLGGRIQLMLGQFEKFGIKSDLTAYNCFVSASPVSSQDPKQQFLNVIETAYKQASIHRSGGGDGINLSTINTVSGSKLSKKDFVFYLPESHPDSAELQDRIKLGKFENVTIVTNRKIFDNLRSNCHTVYAIDSVNDGLFDNAKEMASKAYDGHSIAIDFSKLRERNAIVKGVNGRSSGAVSWMELFVLIARTLQLKTIDAVDFAEIFSFIVNLIQQGGSRRGALMLILNSSVPKDLLLKFITRKQTEGYLQGANISVGIDEVFMQRVKLGKKFSEQQLNEVVEEVRDATEIWNEIIYSAWKSAEPGVVWLERYNIESNSWYFNQLICTNPCNLICMAS